MTKIESIGATGVKEVLRVALDKEATRAYTAMAERLKAENQFVNFHPSELVSYLVADFHRTYFERDTGVLIAEFFDSQAFYQDQVRQAGTNEDFEELMANAMSEIKRIKSRKRIKHGLKPTKRERLNAKSNETV